MSDPKNNLPMIVGVVALLAIAGGAAFYFSNNMTKDPMTASQTAPATGDAAQVAAAPSEGTNRAGEPPATAEEEEEAHMAASAAGGAFNGIEVEKGNPVVARVDGEEITRVDVFRYIKMMPQQVQQMPPEAVYPIAMEQVINTRLVQNKAEDANLESDPEVQEQLNLAKQQIIRTVYVQRAVDSEISDSDIKERYDATVGNTPAVEEIEAAHILVDSEAKAKALIEQLEGGADFAQLAAENSADPGNKDRGGDLGWFTKTDMVGEFSEAAFALDEGATTKEPIQTQFGWHVVKVEDKRNRPKPTLEEVRPMIQVELRREKLESMLQEWKTAAQIETFDINGNPQTSVAPAAGDAPAATAPTAPAAMDETPAASAAPDADDAAPEAEADAAPAPAAAE